MATPRAGNQATVLRNTAAAAKAVVVYLGVGDAGVIVDDGVPERSTDLGVAVDVAGLSWCRRRPHRLRADVLSLADRCGCSGHEWSLYAPHRTVGRNGRSGAGLIGGTSVVATTKQRMVESDAAPPQRRGLAAMSFTEVLAGSGAAPGGIYHHFPGGKAELAAEVVAWTGARIRATFAQLEAQDPAGLVQAFLGAVRPAVQRSAEGASCTVAAVVVEVSPSGSELSITRRACAGLLGPGPVPPAGGRRHGRGGRHGAGDVAGHVPGGRARTVPRRRFPRAVRARRPSAHADRRRRGAGPRTLGPRTERPSADLHR